MLTSKLCSFVRIFSIGYCTLFCILNVLESSVYCNAHVAIGSNKRTVIC